MYQIHLTVVSQIILQHNDVCLLLVHKRVCQIIIGIVKEIWTGLQHPVCFRIQIAAIGCGTEPAPLLLQELLILSYKKHQLLKLKS